MKKDGHAHHKNKFQSMFRLIKLSSNVSIDQPVVQRRLDRSIDRNTNRSVTRRHDRRTPTHRCLPILRGCLSDAAARRTAAAQERRSRLRSGPPKDRDQSLGSRFSRALARTARMSVQRAAQLSPARGGPYPARVSTSAGPRVRPSPQPPVVRSPPPSQRAGGRRRSPAAD